MAEEAELRLMTFSPSVRPLLGWVDCFRRKAVVVRFAMLSGVPWGARYISHAHLRVSAEVDHVLVGRRRIGVASHGHVVVVRASRKPPMVTLVAPDGTQLLEFVPDEAR